MTGTHLRGSLLSQNAVADLGIADGMPNDNPISSQLHEHVSLPQGNTAPSSTDVLNAVLPPIEFVAPGQDGQLHRFRQEVNAEPATRLDVVQLQEALDQRLMERQARESGICPVLEELYGQAFDELIRQVTINSPERGVLLLRVRDEIRMTIAAYNTLFQSSVTFGTRKQIEAEQGKHAIAKDIEQLRAECDKLDAQRQELKNNFDSVQRRFDEASAINERNRKEEIEFMNHQKQHLETFTKSVSQ